MQKLTDEFAAKEAERKSREDALRKKWEEEERVRREEEARRKEEERLEAERLELERQVQFFSIKSLNLNFNNLILQF